MHSHVHSFAFNVSRNKYYADAQNVMNDLCRSQLLKRASDYFLYFHFIQDVTINERN